MEAARSQRFRYAVISQSAADYWWHADDFSERLSACFEHASAAYFVSQANIEVTRRQLVAPLRHARAIQNPFNVRYDAQPPWPHDSSGMLSLACVARLDALQKGQDLLLQVLDRPHWRSRSIRVTFVGTGTNERALRKTVANLKLANVEFAGFVQGIEEFWANHHALVLPSRFEGMPLALVEAMLCARPCIVTDVAGHRELVRDNVNGFLAKAPTVDLLDEAMNRAWENRHRLKQMGEIAAKDVREWVSPDPTGDLVRELDTLLQANHP
jgi:glycosyltransferase involved in cell wall biosynthesis